MSLSMTSGMCCGSPKLTVTTTSGTGFTGVMSWGTDTTCTTWNVVGMPTTFMVTYSNGGTTAGASTSTIGGTSSQMWSISSTSLMVTLGSGSCMYSFFPAFTTTMQSSWTGTWKYVSGATASTCCGMPMIVTTGGTTSTSAMVTFGTDANCMAMGVSGMNNTYTAWYMSNTWAYALVSGTTTIVSYKVSGTTLMATVSSACTYTYMMSWAGNMILSFQAMILAAFAIFLSW